MMVICFCYYDHHHILRVQSASVPVRNPSLPHPLPPTTLQRTISSTTAPMQIAISGEPLYFEL